MTVEASRERIDALYADGLEAFRRDDTDEARRLNDDALALARELDDPATLVKALSGRARIGLRDGDHALVRDLCGEAMRVADSLGDRDAGWLPLHVLAESTRMSGDLVEARALYQRSLSLHRERGDQQMVAVELHNLGQVEREEGNLEAARRLFLDSIDATGDELLVVFSVIGLGVVAAVGDKAAKAARLLGAGEALLEARDTVLDPADRPPFDEAVQRVRAQLGADFDKEWQSGRGLSLDDAVAQARRD